MLDVGINHERITIWSSIQTKYHERVTNHADYLFGRLRARLGLAEYAGPAPFSKRIKRHIGVKPSLRHQIQSRRQASKYCLITTNAVRKQKISVT